MTIADRIESMIERLYVRQGSRYLANSRIAAVALLMVAIGAMVPVYLVFIPESAGNGLRFLVVVEALVLAVSWLGVIPAWERITESVDAWLAGERGEETTRAAWECVRTLPTVALKTAWRWGIGGMLLPAVFYGAIEFDATATQTALAALAGLVVGLWVSTVLIPGFELYLRPLRLDLSRRVRRPATLEPVVHTTLGTKLMVGVPLISVLTGLTLAIVATLPDGDWQELAVLGLVTIGATIGLSTAMVVLVTRALTAPIEDLLAAAESVDDGDLTARAEVTTDDEIGEIGLTFNGMLDSIAKLSDHNLELLREVRASRARIVAASDEERVRVERSINDGVQKRLTALAVRVDALVDHPDVQPAAGEQLLACHQNLIVAIDELRELAQGLHPQVLSSEGLGPALEALAGKALVDVTVDVPDKRWTDGVESTAYFVVSEALANVDKHARAFRAHVVVRELDEALNIEIDDDGVGGATIADDSGLAGLVDRVEAVGGSLVVDSPPRRGTTITAVVPLAVGAELAG